MSIRRSLARRRRPCDSIAVMINDNQNIFKRLKNRLQILWNRHWESLAIFSIIVLVVLAVVGLWRLYKETPIKAPIEFGTQ